MPLTQATETANLLGTGVYSGPGVVQVGANAFKFNPALAGVNESGHTITYTFAANNGCPETIVNKIKVMPKPSLFVDRDVYVLAGGQKMILAEATGFNISYQWSPVTGLSSSKISNPVVTPEKDTEYTVTVTSGNNCIVYQTVYVHVLNSVNPPNTFSPNGDGVNDTWNIAYLHSYPNVTVDIFDRYGAKVFFSKGYSVPFDGTFKNEALPVGTYYYIIDPKNGRSRVTGSLTLIR